MVSDRLRQNLRKFHSLKCIAHSVCFVRSHLQKTPKKYRRSANTVEQSCFDVLLLAASFFVFASVQKQCYFFAFFGPVYLHRCDGKHCSSFCAFLPLDASSTACVVHVLCSQFPAALLRGPGSEAFSPGSLCVSAPVPPDPRPVPRFSPLLQPELDAGSTRPRRDRLHPAEVQHQRVRRGHPPHDQEHQHRP